MGNIPDSAAVFPRIRRLYGAILAVAIAVAAVTGYPGRAGAAIQPGSITVDLQVVADGLVAPLTVTNAGDSRLFFTEQKGQIRIIKNGQLLATPFLDVSSKIVSLNNAADERGLLGLAFHPEYQENGKFYVYYSAPGASQAGWNHHSVVSEYMVSNNPDIADPNSERPILEFDQPQGNHNGGDLHFGPDGYLYIASGDGGAANDSGTGHNPVTGNGQDTTTLLGKILRIDVDSQDSGLQYAIPPSNPYAGAATGRDEIYAIGMRNPYRMSFDPGGARQLFVGDVGQADIEEVSIVTIGGNYGWKAKEGTAVFDQTLYDSLIGQGVTFIDPIAEYDHDDGAAVIGGFVYRGHGVPALQGMYVFADLDGRLLYLDPSQAVPIQIFEFALTPGGEAALPFFIKSFGQDSNGELYVAASSQYGPQGTTGKILRIAAETQTIGAAKLSGPGTPVNLAGKPVTRTLFDRYYIEEPDRSAGIAVMLTRSHTPGTLVNVSGTVQLDSNGELVVGAAADTAPGGAQAIEPLGMNNQTLVGDLPEGLLVRTWGKVVEVGSGGNFRIDDGTGLPAEEGRIGLRVLAGGVPAPPVDSYVSIVGPRGRSSGGSGDFPTVFIADSADIQILD